MIWRPRTILRVAAIPAVVGAAVLWAAPAWAHLDMLVSADDSTPGGRAILTFSVPSELQSGSSTTKLTVALPDLTSVTTSATPGWTTQVDRDLQAGTVKAVTWTASPGAGIAQGEFEQFRLLVRLPKTATATFPAVQTYADGTVVRWDQPGGPAAAHPVPTLTLSARSAGGSQAPVTSAAPRTADTVALWTAAAAAGVAILAAALTYSRARRGK